MHCLLWFKNDLRLEDNPALLACLEARSLLPVYVIDPAHLEPGPLGARKLGVHRARFLLESLAALDSALRQHGSRLLVLPGSPQQVIPRLVEQWQIQSVLTCTELAPEDRQLIAEVRERLGLVPLRETSANSLFDEADLPWSRDAVPTRFDAFRAGIAERSVLFQPRPAPSHLPPLPEHSAALFESLPSLSQLGVGEPLAAPNSAFPFAGGEVAAQARLRDYVWEGLGLRDYRTRRNSLSGADDSSKLAPWLATGCLSVRRLAADLRRHEAQHGASESTRAFWDALLWREFFRSLAARHGEAIYRHGGLAATRQAPTNLDERFTAWCVGRTGMPLVDACMRELAATGYLSGRGRQIVASFLISHLQQDWRHGAAWFEEHLIDHEPSSNWGNWNSLASLCSDPRRQPALNALRMARRFDPDALYVSLWLPELQRVPQNMRHTPFLFDGSGASYPLPGDVPPSWQAYLPTVAA